MVLTGISVVFDVYKLLDLKLILGPLFGHIVLAVVLRAFGLYPFVVDKCLWMGASSAVLFIWWYLLGLKPSYALEGKASDILPRVPEFIQRVELSILIQWYLVIYFLATFMFSHSFSRKGWIIPRKFLGISLLAFCMWRDWSPPSMTIKCVYLIMQIMFVDLGVDFYYLVDSLKEASDVDSKNETREDGVIKVILNVSFPVAMVAWLILVIKDVYVFLVENHAPALVYSIVAYALIIQLAILSPLAWRPSRKQKRR